jgi:Family of unknown function (DUF5678)
MAARDFREIYKKYHGQWVALQGDEVTVIAAAGTLSEAREKAQELGFPNPLMSKVPTDLKIFVG